MVARDDLLRLTGESQEGARLALREWAAEVVENAGSDREAETASDLVVDDRAGRSGERSDASS